MKAIFLFPVFTLIISHGDAQLVPKKKCDDFHVDVLTGKINGVRPDHTMGLIKDKLPCYTGSEPEQSNSKCGGTIVFNDRGVIFYTERNYVEINSNFKGTLSVPLLGSARNSLYKWLGHPKLKDDSWDAFQSAYGFIILHYNNSGKVYLIQLTTESTQTLKLCEQSR